MYALANNYTAGFEERGWGPEPRNSSTELEKGKTKFIHGDSRKSTVLTTHLRLVASRSV
jgi:hypothetical protein